MMNWTPPVDWRRITTIDSHAEGEPFRIITSGIDSLPGATILEKRRFARERLDGLRRTLMFEPRGHADMYGAIVTEPVRPDSDLGVLSCITRDGARCAATASSRSSRLRWKPGCSGRARW